LRFMGRARNLRKTRRFREILIDCKSALAIHR
jgi:hypothetical protein